MNRHRLILISLVLLTILFIYDTGRGFLALQSAGGQFFSMLLIVPPIFVLIGLMDVWIDRETMMKWMGEKSGIIGVLVAFVFGTMAAGPLLGAFPVAMVMLRKGARYANVLFFLMIWASAKLPIVFFQTTTLGLRFTLVSNVTLIVVYLAGSFAIEKITQRDELEKMAFEPFQENTAVK